MEVGQVLSLLQLCDSLFPLGAFAHSDGLEAATTSGAVATSSTAVRRWSHRDHTMHHIIDPATGLPVLDTWRTVSVAAASCTDANIATTAALVRAGAAPAWLAGLGLPARLLDWEGSVRRVGGWPSEAVGRLGISPLAGTEDQPPPRWRHDDGMAQAS